VPPAPANAAPSVKLTRPVAGTAFGPNICMGATASDDAAVAKVEFRVDGKLIATDTTAPYTAGWNASSKTAYGNHTVSATVYDAAGLTAKRQVTVKRTKTAARCTSSQSARRAAAKRAAAQRASARARRR
jgi:hypothetical protein